MRTSDRQPGARVWWASPDGADLRRAEQLAGLLDRVDHARASAYRQPVDRWRYVVATTLVRVAVGAETGVDPSDVRLDRTCPGCGAPHGRVTLPDHPSVHVSITHGGDVVGVAVGATPVGLDVEPVDGTVDPELLEPTVLHPTERDDHPRDESARRHALLLAWVRKESVLKATGDGIVVGLADLVLAPDGRTVRAWPPGVEARDVHVVDVPVVHDPASPARPHVAALAELVPPSRLGAVAAPPVVAPASRLPGW